VTLAQVLAELRQNGLVLTSAEIAHEQVSRFTVVPASVPSTTLPTVEKSQWLEPLEPDSPALDRFMKLKGRD
jgi:hypothetical protein